MSDDDTRGFGEDGNDDGAGGGDIVTDRQFYVSVDRTANAAQPLIDYLRLGTGSDEATYDADESMEHRARTAVTEGGPLSEIEPKIGDDGTMIFTSGGRTEMVSGDSFERVGGRAYQVFTEKHEVFDAANEVSGIDGGLKYTVGKGGDTGIWGGVFPHLTLKPRVDVERIEFSTAMAFKLNYATGLSYTASNSSSIESTGGKFRLKISGFGVEMSGLLGSASFSVKPEFSGLKPVGVSSNFDTPYGGLNHGEKPLHFGEKSITLGLDDDPVREKLKAIFISFVLSLKGIDKWYQYNASGAIKDIDAIKKNPETVKAYATTAKEIAIAGGSFGLAAYAVSMIAAGLQWKKAKALKGNIEGKPYFRIDRTADVGGSNRITLDTGEGASIELTGNTISLRAATINIESNLAAPPYELGAINIGAGTDLNVSANQNAQFSAVGATTVRGNQGITLNAPGQTVTSNANRWTHNGALEAGATTLGATTATTLNVGGAPVAIAPVPALAQAQFQNLPARVQALAGPGLSVALGAALASMLG